MKLFRVASVLSLLSFAVAGCVTQPVAKSHSAASAASAAQAPVVTEPVAPPAPPAPTPGEVALSQGLKAYQSGQYVQAEAQLKAALQAGLPSAADTANVHKHLAFIYCTSKRTALCSAAFKAARAADPAFELTKTESGHPMWGPVYRKAVPPIKP